ncbi:recombinase family protein [Chitinophaga agrisoli]|uniref:Recombinase family protein n=1 Tax=Chitinophaga agrisoli TaxID=2607653 RepID=A0A5B2VR58_9BACT|nr:recombinase family protein [Chitinophaga agrisoli]KAA2241525.1 recombinase family protein [Chitinophaga agrisoli]
MQQAVTYYRVSTDEQGESGLGVEAQQYDVNALLRVSAIVVVREYFEVESGKKNNRRVLKKAIRHCLKAGLTLIIAKCDRLTRKALFGARLLDSRLNLIAADKPWATKLDLLEDFIRAEREGIAISKRTSAALQAAKRRGVKLGKACKALALKNKLAAIAFARTMNPIIQDLAAHGFRTIRALAAELNRRHIPTYRGHGAKWHRNTVCHLLHRIYELSEPSQA